MNVMFCIYALSWFSSELCIFIFVNSHHKLYLDDMIRMLRSGDCRYTIFNDSSVTPVNKEDHLVNYNLLSLLRILLFKFDSF